MDQLLLASSVSSAPCRGFVLSDAVIYIGGYRSERWNIHKLNLNKLLAHVGLSIKTTVGRQSEITAKLADKLPLKSFRNLHDLIVC